MMSDEIFEERRVRGMPPPCDITDSLHAKMDIISAKQDQVLVILEGHHDKDGVHFPGLSHRVTLVEDFVKSSRRFLMAVVLGAMTAVTAAWAILGYGPHK
jgi:hypothetical protein